MKKRVRIKDIAEQAGVSIGTVDRVLHNRGDVNVQTKKKIHDLIEKSGYTPNIIAKSLSLKKSFRIAILVPEGGALNPYWNKPLEGINKALEELTDFHTEIDLIGFDTGQANSFEEQFDVVLSQKPDGIIFAPHFQESAAIKINECEKLRIPYILIDTYIEANSGLAFFGQDAFQSGLVAAKLIHYGLSAAGKLLILHLAKNKAITPHMKKREQGFLSYFKDERLTQEINIEILELDLTAPDSNLLEYISANKNLAGVFVTNSRIYKVASVLGGSGPNKIILAGYDLIDENLECLRMGAVDFLICQKPEQQGYNSTRAMFNYLLTGRKPGMINYSPIDIVIRENSQFYKNSNPYQL